MQVFSCTLFLCSLGSTNGNNMDLFLASPGDSEEFVYSPVGVNAIIINSTDLESYHSFHLIQVNAYTIHTVDTLAHLPATVHTMTLVSHPDPPNSARAALGVLHHKHGCKTSVIVCTQVNEGICGAGDAVHPVLRKKKGLDMRLTMTPHTLPAVMRKTHIHVIPSHQLTSLTSI